MAKTVNQSLADEAVRHRLFLSRYSTQQANAMLALLRKSRVDIAVRLQSALEDGNLTPQNFTVARLSNLMKSTVKAMDKVYSDIFGVLGSDMTTFADHEASYQYNALNKIIPDVVRKHLPLSQVGPAQIVSAAQARPMQGVLLKDWAQKMSRDAVRKVQNAAQTGFLQGESYTDIIKRVQGTKAAGYADGALGSAGKDLSAVVKSTVSHYAATARELTGQANADLIKAREWLSTLDNHTSPMCIIRDKKRYTMDKSPKPIGHQVPYGAGPGKLHYGCRSTETWVTKTYAEMGIPIGEVPEGLRASMSGQVSAEMSYGKWLERQEPWIQDEVLGTTRAQMLADGKVKVSDFFTDKGEWITLDKLKALDKKATGG